MSMGSFTGTLSYCLSIEMNDSILEKCYIPGVSNSNCLEGHILKKKCSAGRSSLEKSFHGPQISGNLRVRLNFSEPTKVDLTLLAIAEFNSVIELNSKGLVMTSYTSK